MQYGEVVIVVFYVGIEVLEWLDSEFIYKVFVFCVVVVNVVVLVSDFYQLQEVVGKDMFSVVIWVFMLESNVFVQVEFVGFFCDIYL